jgi:16S rRNA (guanine966-N2)-methyltransferase
MGRYGDRMRVVAGVAGGRRLLAPPGRRLRPTTDRVREAIFSSLTSMDAIRDARVLDLFAGTGALGIEALSRGAASATFVDADHAAIRAIEENLATTGLGGDARVVHGDALRYVESAERGSGEPFDLALVDPPYAFTEWPRLLAALPARLAVLETGDHVDIHPPWVALRSRRHGDTVVTLVRRQPGVAPEGEEGGDAPG